MKIVLTKSLLFVCFLFVSFKGSSQNWKELYISKQNTAKEQIASVKMANFDVTYFSDTAIAENFQNRKIITTVYKIGEYYVGATCFQEDLKLVELPSSPFFYSDSTIGLCLVNLKSLIDGCNKKELTITVYRFTTISQPTSIAIQQDSCQGKINVAETYILAQENFKTDLDYSAYYIPNEDDFTSDQTDEMINAFRANSKEIKSIKWFEEGKSLLLIVGGFKPDCFAVLKIDFKISNLSIQYEISGGARFYQP